MIPRRDPDLAGNRDGIMSDVVDTPGATPYSYCAVSSGYVGWRMRKITVELIANGIRWIRLEFTFSSTLSAR